MSEEYSFDILIIEDNPHDVELALRALRVHNLTNKVKILKDGAEALDYLLPESTAKATKVHYPKAIFLDLKLPKVNGIEVLRRLRADDRTRLLPVVIMTSSQEERDVVEAYELGVNSYVVKPLNFEQFAKTMADLGYYWAFTNHTPSS